MRRLALLIFDVFLMFSATLFSLELRENFDVSGSRLIENAPYLIATVIVSFLVFPVLGLNRTIWRFSSLPDHLRMTAAVGIVVFGAVSLTFAYNRLDEVARSLPMLQFLVGPMFLIGARVLHKMSHDARQHRKTSASLLQPDRGAPAVTVVIVGISKLTEAYLQAAAELVPGRIRIAGLVSRAKHVGRVLSSHPVLGIPEDIEHILDGLEIHGVNIDRIVVACSFDSLTLAERDALLETERSRDIPLQFLAEDLGFDVKRRGFSGSIANGQHSPSADLKLSFEISPTELDLIARRPYWRAKKMLDCLLAFSLLAVCSPLLLAIALLVAATVGFPVLFWQQRPGMGGRPFRLYKFRTMKPAYGANGRRLSDGERLSRVGNIMRRLRLDELPQLFNIVRGDMSFIGPRPLLSKDQEDAYRARLLVRPGLSGWAQVVGGRNISPEDKAALDVWYVRNASFALDIQIVARTIPVVIFGERISRELIERAWRDLSESEVLRGDLAVKIRNSLEITTSQVTA